MTEYESRQQKTGSDSEELAQRISDTRKLVDSLIGRHAEYFADSNNRLEFLEQQNSDDFFRMAQHVNARLRGAIPAKMRNEPGETGGFLPLLHTPSSDDKPQAFKSGFNAIQEYLLSTDDNTDVKIEATAMAVEALVIWVHPFNDGNGRTARFMAKLIEDGASDVESLVDETVSALNRPLSYSQKPVSREELLSDAENTDIMYDDNERNDIRKRAEDLPDDIETIYLGVKQLLEDEHVRSAILLKAEAHRSRKSNAA